MASFTESSSSARDIRALVFDCDGTVLDTMEFYWPTWQATCGKQRGSSLIASEDLDNQRALCV